MNYTKDTIDTPTLCEIAPSGMSIPEAVRWLRSHWHLTGTLAKDINSGDCEEFASCLLAILSYKQETDYACIDGDGMNGPGHYWAVIGGKCYDPECPDGVKDPRHLPIMKRYIRKHPGIDPMAGE